MPKVIRGFDQLTKALRDSPQIAKPLIKQAMTRSILVIEGILKTYPPATEANKPGRWRQVQNKHSVSLRPMGYYERRKGWWYPVMKKSTLGPRPKKSEGRMTAKRTHSQYGMSGSGGIAGYKLVRSSEDLGKHWTHEVTVGDNEVVGVVGNTASYAPPVQGPRMVQSKRMAAIGWPNVDDAVEQAMPDVSAAFSEACDRLIEAI